MTARSHQIRLTRGIEFEERATYVGPLPEPSTIIDVVDPEGRPCRALVTELDPATDPPTIVARAIAPSGGADEALPAHMRRD